jgi:hypothetical protein
MLCVLVVGECVQFYYSNDVPYEFRNRKTNISSILLLILRRFGISMNVDSSTNMLKNYYRLL